MTHLQGACRRPPQRPRMSGQRHRLPSAGCPELSQQRLQNLRSHTCAQASVVFSDLRDEARVVLRWLSQDYSQTGLSSPMPCLDSIQRQVMMSLAHQMMCIPQTDMDGHMKGAYQLISSPKRVITRAYAGASESVDPWACSVGSPFSRIMLSGRPHATLNCAAMILPLSGDVLAAQSPVRDSHVLSKEAKSGQAPSAEGSQWYSTCQLKCAAMMPPLSGPRPLRPYCYYREIVSYPMSRLRHGSGGERWKLPPMAPPRSPPRADPSANSAISSEAAKSLKPSSCSHSVMKTIAFHGMLPTIPYKMDMSC